MIKSWKSKALQRFFEEGDARKIDQNQKKRIAERLLVLHKARTLEEVNVPGWNFHRWSGDESILSIKISGNWRILFRWHKGDAYDVDLADPHSRG
jgi:proteic killer suppression protein